MARTPDFSWVQWDEHAYLLELLGQSGGEARFVGGAVRDTLLGATPDDFDMATTHVPERTTAILQSADIPVIPTGIAQGTVTALLAGRGYEITTLRHDVHTDGRWAEVSFTTSWEEDALRRDFTMGSIYVDADGQIYDYVGGVEDTLNRRVRFIGDPYQRIREDYLRILRFFRMQAYYGNPPFDSEGFAACCALKEGLDQISGERITKELMKLLGAPDPWPCLRALFEAGFFPILLGRESSGDVFLERLAFLERVCGEQAPTLVRLRALGETPCPRLRLSRRQEKFLSALAPTMHPGEIFQVIEESLYEVGAEVTVGRLWMGAFCSDEEADETAQWLAEVLAIAEETPLHVFPLRGSDIVAYGIMGPRVGALLDMAKKWWIAGGATASREECLAFLEGQGMFAIC